MIVYRICQTYPPDHNPIDGAGAAKFGGRWNAIGVYMVYTSASLAIARSELARHINLEDVPDGFRVYEIEIPDQSYLEIAPLPAHWDEDPEPIETQRIGVQYFSNKSTLAIKVPSVCDPSSFNYLLNPECSNYHLVTISADYPFKA